MTDLDLKLLPDLPQCRTFAHFAPRFWEQASVRGLWIGGSLARGDGDPYSDIDLRLAVSADALEGWNIPDFDSLFAGMCLGTLFISFGARAFLHHLVLSNGDIYDVWVQDVAEEVHDPVLLLLGCRDEALARRLTATKVEAPVLPTAADGETVRKLLVHYWITTHKHRKVLYRDLPLIVLAGVQVERELLQRLWYIEATGYDSDNRAGTIHSLSEIARVLQKTRGGAALALLGAPLTDSITLHNTLRLLRDEVAQVGRTLAARLDFAYPELLEQTVRAGWNDFLQKQAPV